VDAGMRGHDGVGTAEESIMRAAGITRHLPRAWHPAPRLLLGVAWPLSGFTPW